MSTFNKEYESIARQTKADEFVSLYHERVIGTGTLVHSLGSMDLSL